MNLKLPKLPDRTPVKITIALSPDLFAALSRYQALYKDVYGTDDPITELVPAMLASFLESDRAFARSQRGAS